MVKFCVNCGTSLTDDVKFCTTCGTPVQQVMPVQEPPVQQEYVAPTVQQEYVAPPVQQEYVAPPVQQEYVAPPVQQEYVAPPVQQEYVAPPVQQQYVAPPVGPMGEMPVVPAPEKKKGSKKPLIISLIAVGIIAVLIGGFFLVTALLGGSGEAGYVAYVKDDEMYFSYTDNASPAELTNELYGSGTDYYSLYYGSYYQGYTYLSEDGSILFYVDEFDSYDDCFTLMYKYTNDLDADGVEIASNVMSFYVSSDAKVVTYVTASYDKGLFRYDFDTTKQLDDDVWNVVVSADGYTVLFENYDGDFEIDVYGGISDKIEEDVDDFIYTSDLSIIYYTIDGELHKYVTADKADTEIDESVEDLISIGADGIVYYTKDDSTVFTLSDFIYDDMASEDEAIQAPEYPEYPDFPFSFDYETDEEYEMALDEYYAQTDIYYDLVDQYYEDYSNYYDVDDRNDIRDVMEDELTYSLISSLYSYDGDSSTLITDGFIDIEEVSYESGVIVYSAIDFDSFEKLNLSELDSYYINYIYYDIEDALEEAVTKYIYNGTSAIVTVEDAVNFDINSSGTEIYFMDYASLINEHGDLYKIEISNGSIGAAYIYDTEVYCDSYIYDDDAEFISDSKYMYSKEYEYGEVTLYINGEEIDEEVNYYNVVYVESTDTLIYYSYDEYAVMIKSGNSDSVELEVILYDYEVNPVTGEIVYLADYDYMTGYCSLYVYRNGKTILIDEEVQAIVGTYNYQSNILY